MIFTIPFAMFESRVSNLMGSVLKAKLECAWSSILVARSISPCNGGCIDPHIADLRSDIFHGPYDDARGQGLNTILSASFFSECSCHWQSLNPKMQLVVGKQLPEELAKKKKTSSLCGEGGTRAPNSFGDSPKTLRRIDSGKGTCLQLGQIPFESVGINTFNTPTQFGS